MTTHLFPLDRDRLRDCIAEHGIDPGQASIRQMDALVNALEQAFGVEDPATRAGAASAAVVRGSDGLGLAIQGLFSQGDDRVMNDVLQAVVRAGSPAWKAVVELGLKADFPTIRELAVDAAASTCDEANKPLMEGLLTDEDPHVAVRAASALYLMVGSSVTP
jgi:HEAT repeat protein